MNFDSDRALRWCVPTWLGLSALTIGLTVTHVARPAVVFLWVAPFLGSVAAIDLMIVAAVLRERGATLDAPRTQSG